jgi:hypothetical protein
VLDVPSRASLYSLLMGIFAIKQLTNLSKRVHVKRDTAARRNSYLKHATRLWPYAWSQMLPVLQGQGVRGLARFSRKAGAEGVG